VIGGTGQLGALVVRQLRGDGHRVRLLAERSQQLATGMQARGMSRRPGGHPPHGSQGRAQKLPKPEGPARARRVAHVAVFSSTPLLAIALDRRHWAELLPGRPPSCRHDEGRWRSVTFGFIGWDERTGSRSEPPKYDGLGGAGAGMIARLLDRAIPCQQIVSCVAAIADSRGDHHDCRRSACDRRHRSSASLTSWPAGWSSARTPAWSEGQTPSTGRSPISRTDRTRPAPLAVGSPTST
jgi:hypothetical protein